MLLKPVKLLHGGKGVTYVIRRRRGEEEREEDRRGGGVSLKRGGFLCSLLLQRSVALVSLCLLSLSSIQIDPEVVFGFLVALHSIPFTPQYSTATKKKKKNKFRVFFLNSRNLQCEGEEGFPRGSLQFTCRP